MTGGVSWRFVAIDETEGDVWIIRLAKGRYELVIMAEVELGGRLIILDRCHIQGAGANTLGARALRELIVWAKEEFDVDEIRIVPATRTSGAHPGRRPPPVTAR